MNRFLWVFASVASALLLCNPTYAGEKVAFTDDFHVGGYAAANLNLHPGGVTEATASEASLFMSWDGNGRWRLFSELEIENPMHWKEGKSISTDKSDLDVERMYADYVYSEHATLRMGRFLDPGRTLEPDPCRSTGVDHASSHCHRVLVPAQCQRVDVARCATLRKRRAGIFRL